MKNLVDSLTASLAPRPWDQDGPAAALSALSAASILPAGGMNTMRVCKEAQMVQSNFSKPTCCLVCIISRNPRSWLPSNAIESHCIFDLVRAIQASKSASFTENSWHFCQQLKISWKILAASEGSYVSPPAAAEIDSSRCCLCCVVTRACASHRKDAMIEDKGSWFTAGNEPAALSFSCSSPLS